MSRTDAIIIDILHRGLDDWVSLGEVAWIVREYCRLRDPVKAKHRTINVVEKMFNEGLVAVGDLVASRGGIVFRPWATPAASVKGEIEKRWLRYGGAMSKDGANDVCWLSNTETGNKMVGKE